MNVEQPRAPPYGRSTYHMSYLPVLFSYPATHSVHLQLFIHTLYNIYIVKISRHMNKTIRKEKKTEMNVFEGSIRWTEEHSF